jgi:hypothetical protein
MRTFSFYMRDDHQPMTVHISAPFKDEPGAREFALSLLDESSNRNSIEVREGGRVLFSVDRTEQPPSPSG